MHFTTLLTCLAVTLPTGWAGYTLEDDYMSGNFFDQFSFFDAADPTNGFVSYQDKSNSQAQHLIGGGTGGSASFGVDNSTVTPNGRPSVRITSNKSYQSGLFILDVAHMPGGICGTWPAFWMVGPDWPNQGEIDIIEGVNDQQSNDMTLHTGPGCTIGGSKAKFSGSLVSSNCVSGSGDNQGCQIATQNTATYGTDFNNNGGGVYATEWTDKSIAIYWFPRGNIPSDVLSDSPNPSSWGEPLAKFAGGCDYGTSFTNQQIVFDTTFCGDWAGQVWSGSTCAASTGSSTCEDFVANNPTAFDDAYWTVNGLKVYQNNGGAAPPQSTGWGGQSSFATQTTAWPNPLSSPAGSAAPTSEPAWPNPLSSPAGSPAPTSAVPNPLSSPAGSPAPSHPAFSNPLSVPGGPQPTGHGHGHGHGISEVSGVPQWPASQTFAQDRPQQSWGGWNEVDNGDGSWSVGRPVGNEKREPEAEREVNVKRIHSRHLAKHKRRHGAGLI